MNDVDNQLKGNFQRKNPYSVLNASYETVQNLPSEKKKDEFLMKRMKYLKTQYLNELEKKTI